MESSPQGGVSNWVIYVTLTDGYLDQADRTVDPHYHFVDHMHTLLLFNGDISLDIIQPEKGILEDVSYIY